MSLTLHIILGLLLLLAFYQDWKFRAITWFVFPLLAIVSLLIFWQPGKNWEVIGSNLSFVFVVMTTLVIYVSLREKRWTNVFKKHFGIGDLLFFIAVSPLFGNNSFIVFFITGMILSGIFHLAISYSMTNKSIPLAGYMAIYLIVLKVSAEVINIDLFDHDFIQ